MTKQQLQSQKYYFYTCKKCKRKHKHPAYAIAQMSQGHELTHTCECGSRNEINL